jgi:hypothetical protein
MPHVVVREIFEKLKRGATEVYALSILDQAKRSTNVLRVVRAAQIHAQSERKKILLSLAAQDIHHSSTGFAHRHSHVAFGAT